MKKPIFIACLASLLSTPVLVSEEMKLESEMDKVSHIIGHDVGMNLKRIEGLNLDVFIKSFKAAREGKEMQLDQAVVQQTMMAFQQKMQQKEMAKMAKEGEANVKAGEAYLASNAKKEGVKTTESGLQYKVIKAGTGPIPKSTDTISAHYEGTLIDGTKFDSSYDRGQPATFPVTGVIPGWVEALQLMNVGSVWELTIPGNLAYGPNPPRGSKIGPNSVLKFKIELVGIQ